jgi:hypothetical protein
VLVVRGLARDTVDLDETIKRHLYFSFKKAFPVGLSKSARSIKHLLIVMLTTIKAPEYEHFHRKALAIPQ